MDPPSSKTLKEKMMDQWDKSTPFSKGEQASAAGICFFWIYSITMMYVVSKFVLPNVLSCYWDYELFRLRVVLWVLFIETVINWFLSTRFIINNQVPARQQNTEKFKESQPDGWSYCAVCQVDLPPRAYHCNICKMCILKREQHCFITGGCIGYYNQRHFIVFTFYSLISNLYILYGMWYYFKYMELSWGYIPFVAFFQWLDKHNWAMTGEKFLMVCLLNVCVVVVIASAYFFLWQMSIIITGRTTHEAAKGLKKYESSGILNNYKSVFGPFGILQFIVPLPIPVGGDGIHWNIGGGSKWE